MKNMKYCFFSALVAFVLMAVSQADQSKMETIKYATYEQVDGKEKKVIYCLKVPRGGKQLTVFGSHEKEQEVLYPDSSYIYITNDAKAGSHLNYNNVARLDKGAYARKLLEDTVLLEGVQPDGRFWKEDKLGNIVVGYVNVTASQKSRYDASLRSLKIR
jgi:hypothetical protein